jgi:hypothetical protein
MNSNKIVNVTTPTAGQEAANKSYVDGALTGGSIVNNPTVADAANGNANYRVLFTTATSGRATLNHDESLTYNAALNTLYAGIFGGPAHSAYNLSAPMGHSATILTDGGTRMSVTTAGFVGIGTTTPNAPLHVAKTASVSLNGYTADFYSYGAHEVTGVWNKRWILGGAYPMGIISDGDIWIKSNYIWISSDKRIKKNIRDIHGNNALSQLRKIQPKIYNYIDFTNGNQDIYGFIAQDVEDIITSSSKIVKDYIPNFYCKGDIFIIEQANHIYEISTETEFKFEKVLDNGGNEISNYHIKLYDEKNNEYICTVIHRIDGNTIRVKCDKEYKFSTTEKYKNTVFIYGQEVHDFHNLDKNSIFTVATAALQEVDRQQQADKARIAELEAKVSDQQSLINDILERLNALEKA